MEPFQKLANELTTATIFEFVKKSNERDIAFPVTFIAKSGRIEMYIREPKRDSWFGLDILVNHNLPF